MLYQLHETYWANFNRPLAHCPSTSCPWRGGYQTFLGLPLRAPVGVSACPLTKGSGIRELARLGYDFFVYKTIRSRFSDPHPYPNVVYVKDRLQAHQGKLWAQWVDAYSSESLANSLGIPSRSLNEHLKDIDRAKSHLVYGQLLAVSIHGEGQTIAEWERDTLNLASAVRDARADMIEINLSCPNLISQSGLFDYVEAIQRIQKAVNPKPVVVKLAAEQSLYHFEQKLEKLANAGVSAISGINAYRARVQTAQGSAAFNQRPWAGVSGKAIQQPALDFVRQARSISWAKRLDLCVIGMGGIVKPGDYDVMLNSGADVALSATGVMLNPYLAWERTHGIQQASADSCVI